LYPRRVWSRVFPLACVTLVVAGPVSIAQGTVERAEPLEVPGGPPPGAEWGVHLEAAERLQQAAEQWRAHGYENLPLLALAALAIAERDQDPEFAALALEWAPGSPAVQLEAARLTNDPLAFIRSLIQIPRTFPGLAWLGALALGALGLAGFVGMVALAGLCFLRTLPLLGHSLGHLWSTRPGAAWPGALLLICAIAALPLVGVGPALLLAFAIAAALVYIPAREGISVLAVLVLAGVALGPALDWWASLATVPGPGSGLMSAWRMERAQPLPRDREVLEERMALGVAAPLERLVLATTLKRERNLKRAEALVREIPSGVEPAIAARAANLMGTVRLARGEVRSAIRAFSEARGQEPSAAVLYNLSQAYGRAIQLEDQSKLFSAARKMDPSTVSRASDYTGINMHHYLIEPPVPLRNYISEVLRAGPDAQILAAEVRSRALGPSIPPWGWLLLPGLGILGQAIKVRSLRRCPRCLRTMCQRCTPSKASGSNCLRCRRLFVVDDAVDPRVLRRELKRDRWRQRLIVNGVAFLGLSVPGSTDVLNGRTGLGVFVLLCAVAGAGLFVSSSWLLAPIEVGDLSSLLTVTVGTALLGLAYLASGARAVGGWTRAEDPQ
jgi:tetratricopeptide (TPR) repeat protein